MPPSVSPSAAAPLSPPMPFSTDPFVETNHIHAPLEDANVDIHFTPEKDSNSPLLENASVENGAETRPYRVLPKVGILCKAGARDGLTEDELEVRRKRRVRWPDDNGDSLTTVKEFEASDSGSSDDDSDRDGGQSCSCTIQ